MLTNEAEFVLLQLYRYYQDRIEDGMNKREARYFEDERSVHHNLFVGLDPQDFNLALVELSKNGYLKTPKLTSDGYPEFVLEPIAIAEMENRYNKNFKQIVSRINTLRKLVTG